MGWGGKRVGAGRKPKQKETARVLNHPSSTPSPTTNGEPPVEEFDCPNSLLDPMERAVWMTQAPHAFKNRTLTKATALSFERYCRLVVAERHEGLSSGRNATNHRGLIKQINSLELQFMLAPAGKPMIDPTPVQQQDADDAFFGGPHASR